MGPLTWHDDHISDGEKPWALLWRGNLATALPAPGASPRLVLRSGWIEADPERPALSWAAPARAKLDESIEAALTALRPTNIEILLHPLATDLVSDIPSALGVLRKWSAQPLGLLLEPAALFTESMLPRAEDHLQRMGEALGEHPATAAVFVSNIRFSGAEPTRTPIDAGQLPPPLLRRFAQAAAAAGKRVVMLPADRQS